MNRSIAYRFLASFTLVAIVGGAAPAIDEPSPEHPFIYERSVWFDADSTSQSIQAIGS